LADPPGEARGNAEPEDKRGVQRSFGMPHRSEISAARASIRRPVPRFPRRLPLPFRGSLSHGDFLLRAPRDPPASRFTGHFRESVGGGPLPGQFILRCRRALTVAQSTSFTSRCRAPVAFIGFFLASAGPRRPTDPSYTRGTRCTRGTRGTRARAGGEPTFLALRVNGVASS
jgi:hypothetical protein